MRCDPDFCENRCPVCTRARRGGRLARLIQRVELLLTLGGCPWGRARRRRYGVAPDRARPTPAGGTTHVGDGPRQAP